MNKEAETLKAITDWLEKTPHPDCPEELERAEKYVREGLLEIIKDVTQRDVNIHTQAHWVSGAVHREDTCPICINNKAVEDAPRWSDRELFGPTAEEAKETQNELKAAIDAAKEAQMEIWFKCPHCSIQFRPKELRGEDATPRTPLRDDEELNRKLIDYLVENDGQDSIEELAKGALNIVDAALRAATPQPGSPMRDALKALDELHRYYVQLDDPLMANRIASAISTLKED